MHQGWREREVAALGARQRQLITRDQLAAIGIGRSATTRALQRGRIYRLHVGVYALAPRSALPPLAEEQAALLACGASTAISHRSAARIWSMLEGPYENVDVTIVGHGRGRHRQGIRAHQACVLHRPDLRRHQGLVVTAPARTLLDIAADLPSREFERIFNEAIVRRLITRRAVLATLGRYPGHRGCMILRELCAGNRLTRSDGERVLLALIRRAGLPHPETNARFGRFEVDFLWREQKVAVELDGHAFHASRAAPERDHAKDLELQRAGFVVIRVSGRQLQMQSAMVIAWIAGALACGPAPVAGT